MTLQRTAARWACFRRLAIWVVLLFAGASALSLAPAATAATPDQVGEWGPVMDFGVPGTHMVLMHNGKVLLWRNGKEARVWDPANGQLTPAADPFPNAPNFHCAGQVVLSDGRVLAVGGTLTKQHEGIASTSTFDPATNTWTHQANMNFPRWYPSVTLLGDGRVLAANGEDASGIDVPTYEVYDPAANSWTYLSGADRHQDIYAFNALLPDGRVFEASPRPLSQLLDVGTRAWSPSSVSGWRTLPFTESDAIYAPGKILRVGGTTIPDLVATKGATNRAMTIDMTSPSPRWGDTSPMAFARRRLNLVSLADGQVMAVGGTGASDDPAQAVLAGEIWNPDSGQWTTVASMAVPRMYHSSALLLPDGRVLTAGGEPVTAGKITPRTAQVYSPPYLFKGPRPTISAAPTAVPYGGSFSVATPDANIASVALIRPSAVTHAYDMDQRFVPLSFARTTGGVTVSAPASGNIAPPGYYMMVIKNAAGVPSVASWVQVGTTSKVVGAPAISPGAAGPATRPGTRPLRVLIAGRIGLRRARSHGLRITLQLPSSGRRVVRVRLFRVLPGARHRLLATTLRRVQRADTLRLTFRSRALRHALRPGRYELQVASGSGPRRLGPPVRRTFTIIRP